MYGSASTSFSYLSSQAKPSQAKPRQAKSSQVDELLAYIGSKDKTIKLRIDCNDSEIQELVDEGETTWEIIDAADAYIARAFALCLDESADRVRRFKVELRNHPHRDQIRSSGQYYGTLMTSFNKAASSTEAREDKNKFN